MLFKHFRKERSRSAPGGCMGAGLGLHAVTNRLAEECMGVLLTDQIEQIPGSVREDHAMHLSSVLNGEEQTVECFLRTGSSNGSKCAFSFLCIFVVNGFTNGFATLGALGDSSGCDHMKNLLFAPALFLNAISISVENLEDR